MYNTNKRYEKIKRKQDCVEKNTDIILYKKHIKTYAKDKNTGIFHLTNNNQQKNKWRV